MSQFIEMFGGESNKVPLEEIVVVKDDCRRPINEGVRSEMKDGELYPYYGATGVVDYINDYLTDDELLCIAEDCGNYNAGEESAYIIRGKAWVNNHAHLVKAKEFCDIKYLYYFLKIADLKPYVSGTTRLKLTQKKLKEISVTLPSTDKQKTFVNIAEQADKSEFVGCKSQFIEMFGGMTTTPIKDYIDDSFPGEWGTEDKDGNGVKVIRTTNFTNSGKLNLEDVVTRNIEERKVSRKRIKKYDTILERSGGTAENPVGRVVLFEEDEQYLCNNFTQVLRFKNIDPRFAFYALYYFYQTNKTAIRSMGSKTTGIQNLNMGKYQEIGVPNASDEQQEAFVSIAEQADKSEYYN